MVTGSTKWPSPTSKWKTRHSARSSTSSWSPRCAKSAPYSEGSTSTVRIQSSQGTKPMLRRAEAGDEEAARPVAVGPREQELGPGRMRVLRPFFDRVDLEAGRLDNRLVLVGVERADA